MAASGNEPMPDEPNRRAPARPTDRPYNQQEPRPRSHPADGEAAAGRAGGIEEVPQGGAVGPGPAIAQPPADDDH